MTHPVRLFMLFEAAAFVVASAIHFGALIVGYEDQAAGIAEGVIAAVLLAGVMLTWIRPAWLRWVGLAAQGFALLGTSVGIFTILVVGIGPRTVPDLVYHIGIVLVLALGMSVAARARPGEAGQRG